MPATETPPNDARQGRAPAVQGERKASRHSVTGTGRQVSVPVAVPHGQKLVGIGGPSRLGGIAIRGAGFELAKPSGFPLRAFLGSRSTLTLGGPPLLDV